MFSIDELGMGVGEGFQIPRRTQIKLQMSRSKKSSREMVIGSILRDLGNQFYM